MTASEPEEFETDEGEVLISALEHYCYCPRQCALIHLEQTFDENVFTIRGRLTHETVDEGEGSRRAGVKLVRSIPLWSTRLSLYGKADLVELRSEGPYPVEYKPGRRHGIGPDVQLCAQALCLEEMMNLPVRQGAIYYAATRGRHEVEIGEELRRQTMAVITGVRDMLRSMAMPPAPNDERCLNCSLGEICMPRVVAEPARLRGLQGTLFRPLEMGEDDV